MRHRPTAPDDRRVPSALARGHRPGMDTFSHRPAPLHSGHQDLDTVLARPQPAIPSLRPDRAVTANLATLSLLKTLNTDAYLAFPVTQKNGEESTAWPMVS